MAFTNSPLVTYSRQSPNRYIDRKHKIDTITPHVVVGHLSLETIGNLFADKKARASCNYAVDDNGKVGLYVDEKDASWCTSSESNDRRAVTIEIACDRTHPYAITDKALSGVINLCADICKRNDIPKLMWQADKTLIGAVDKQNISVHRWFANKACPGDYVYSRLGYIADSVNKLLAPAIPPANPPYRIRVNTGSLNYRRSPGTNSPIVGRVHMGEVYTIIEESLGVGASKWGRLKSGAGWIALDHCVRLG